MTRDERQEEAVGKWIEAKCKGTIVATTGFGKTWIAINCINKILKQKPLYKIIIVVPTIGLREQWVSILDKNGLSLNAEVVVINTASTHVYKCNLLIIDELHKAAANQMIHIFNTIKYQYVLGLTATFERLDGRHEILAKYCPICDEITLSECLINGWIAEYKEYRVILDVPDIAKYKQINKTFMQHFEFFDFSWDTVRQCTGKDGYKFRRKLAIQMCPYGDRDNMLKLITVHAMQVMRVIQERKAFINNHDKKIEVTRHIIELRPRAKIITFSNNVKTAERIGGGYIYTGKESVNKNRMTLDEFKNMKEGVLHTVKKADTGLDIPGLSVAIMLGIDSSKIRATQSRGRVIRKEGDKTAEIFVLTINDTVEQKWFEKSRIGDKIITIDERGLEDVLAYKDPKPYRKPVKQFSFRF